MNKTLYSKERRKLSELLINAREKCNLTQKQVGEAGFISQSELSKIENGQRKVDFLILLKLAQLYKKPVTFFVPTKK